jgi:hypothetical protein
MAEYFKCRCVLACPGWLGFRAGLSLGEGILTTVRAQAVLAAAAGAMACNARRTGLQESVAVVWIAAEWAFTACFNLLRWPGHAASGLARVESSLRARPAAAVK